MKNYQLIVFDWDGTLIDSVGRIVASMQAAAQCAGLTIPSDQDVRSIIGLSLPVAFETLFPHRTSAQERLLITGYQEQYTVKNNVPAELFPCAINLLNILKAQGKLLAVATGKGRAGLERVWRATNTGHYFHASRCADEYASKPDPHMLVSLLAHFDIAAEHALMIGDSRHDMEMAQRAKVDSIGISHGVDSADVLNGYQPKAIVDSLESLQQLLCH